MIETLLNPNFAYLFLVAGFFLAILAMLTPGTGILEIGALFAFVFAGWAVYNLPINYWALVVLILGVIPFLFAVRRSGQYIYLGLSILALVIGSAYLFRGEVWWQPAVNPVLAAIVSLLTGGFLWIITRKTIEVSLTRPSHDLEALLGLVGEAKTDIHEEGSLQVAGELWSATSSTLIPAGAHARVIGREGFMLQVEILPEDEEPS
ncbi:MAG TPA: NfeD family protein [Anaerolineales bacterium]|nr:NfeD family protein [Anaerolineales bacterium]